MFIIEWFQVRTLADPLDGRYPIRRMYWLSRFAGGPLRAIRRWWALRQRETRYLDHQASMRALCREPGESDADFRARILADLQS